MTKLKYLRTKRNFVVYDLKELDKGIENRLKDIAERISSKCSNCNGLGYIEQNTSWGNQRQQCNCMNGIAIRPIWLRIFSRIQKEININNGN